MIMQTELSLKTFLEDYGESLAEKVTRDLKVIHDPARDREEQMDLQMDRLRKNPFPAQREIIKAVVKCFRSGNKAVYMTAEMGTGKTLMSIAVASMLKENPQGPRHLPAPPCKKMDPGDQGSHALGQSHQP